MLFPGALGDFLCFAEALFGLRRCSSAPLTVFARPAWTSLLDAHEFSFQSIEVRGVAELFGVGDLDIAREHFSAAAAIYSWTGHGDEGFAERLASMGAARTAVYPFRAFAPAEHASDYYARCLGVAPAPVEIHVGQDASAWVRGVLGGLRRPLLAVHAGSGSAQKNWSGFSQLADFWRAESGSVVEIVGPADGPALSGADRIVSEELPLVAGLLAAVDVYVGNDSGITHLAAALDVPGVALFRNGSAEHWRPRSELVRVIEAGPGCSACQGGLCRECLPLEPVAATIRAMRQRVHR